MLIDNELVEIEKRLQKLEEEKRTLLARQTALSNSEPTITEESSIPCTREMSPQQKVKLFRSLFRGRDDIYALRWENKKGRSGYSVACSNEWVSGLCNKPQVKCGDCQNRSFSRLDDRAIYDHLAGKCTLGLYPLLGDNNCWLLAADFDKSDWQQAVCAFRSACQDFGISCAVERSRSGNGAHAWIFFDNPIAAKDARKLGFALLDKAMENHAGLSFDSYDRLFPNQDLIPTGGFGNLIALPLQHGPRKIGNSAFVDERLQAFADQWSFLASIKRVPAMRVNSCLEATLTGTTEIKDDIKPWEKGLPVGNEPIPDCPAIIELVLANRIYIPTEDLPQVLLARLKRLASFSNPVFFKTQALRFSTQGIPRFICLAHIEQGYLSLPRGCIDEVISVLNEQLIEIKINDKRRPGILLKGIKFKGGLRKDQKKAVADINRHDVGILHAPTAFGKTVTAIGLIIKRKVNTLILVHSRHLLDQWKERLTSFIDGAEIGVIGGGKRKATGQIDVATYQSMINRSDNSVDDTLFDYGQIIIDECHHLSAPKYEALLNEVHAKYVVGLTATPQRQDGHQPIVFMQAGPIRHSVKTDSRHHFEQRVIVRKLFNTPPMELTHTEIRPHIADIYRWLTESDERNKKIIEDVVTEINNQRNPLILTERREHALALGQLLGEKDISYQVLRGAMKVRERKAAMDALDETQVLVATGKYIGEGFDLSKLDTLFLALPISWKGSLAQYAGRIHRQIEGKDRVFIYDYVDMALPTLQRMFQRRTKGYEAMGYTMTDGNEQSLIQSKMVFPAKQ